MRDKQIFTISSFAEFSQTTRGTLIYYDKIDLLKPVYRAKNGYRYYSASQLAVVNLIRTCQSSGIPLNDIKSLIKYRTPAIMQGFLSEQIIRINNSIGEQLKTQKLLTHLKSIIDTALAADTSEISVQTLPEEAIVMGGVNDYSKGRNDYDALLDFYRECEEKYPDMDMNYPVWGFFREQQVKSNNCDWPERYYFSNPEGTDRRPQAQYAVGYGTGGYGGNDELHRRVISFIQESGYRVCGPAYREYPLNEISVTDDKQYLIRFLVTVTK